MSDAQSSHPRTPSEKTPASFDSALEWMSAVHIGTVPAEASSGDILASAPPPRRLSGPILTPILAVLALVVVYVVAMTIWPLHEVAPRITAVESRSITAPASAMSWPEQGSGAVGVGHVGEVAASDTTMVPIASIGKLLSALLVLDRMPLSLGESGPDFHFTQRDRNDYHQYLWRSESALDVPVGGTLSQYQVLQGSLIGSANNYADRLVREIWGSAEVYRAAAAEWLNDRGLDGITLVDYDSVSANNVANPAAVIRLGEIAMANPVIREIVGTPAVVLPGAGLVENTNLLLGEGGITGVKTGTLRSNFHLVASKDVEIAGTRVQLFAATLQQASREQRDAVIRELFAQLEEEVRAQISTIRAGTVVGTVTTEWGETSQAITASDIRTVLWNTAVARIQTDLSISWDLANVHSVGTHTAIGPLGANGSEVVLEEPLSGPGIWWRLTHPLQLLGLSD